MSNETLQMTPYEKFLRESLEDEKKRLEELNARYSKANPFKKMQLKRELDQLNQNVQLLTADLDHYLKGLHWLREPSKERDEKAEHLKPVPVEAITGQAPSGVQQAKPVAATGVAQPRAAPIVGRPTIGQPVGTQVSRPISAPIQTQPSQSASQTATAVQVSKPVPSAPRVGTPMVGKPVDTPVLGKPVTSSSTQAPRVGTPIGTPIKKEEKTTTPTASTEEGQQTNQKQEERAETEPSDTASMSSSSS